MSAPGTDGRAKRATVVVLLACLVALAGCDGGFDPEVWRAEKGGYDRDNRRAGMVSELMDTRLKPGARRDELLALLGPADASGDDRETYYLGRSPYGVSYETLDLVFDREGRLLTAQFRRS